MQENISDIDRKSYKQILKSTSIMGVSSIITILLRIIRTKVIAVILGPTGVGLIGIYESITSAVGAISGMGLETSGVRQIAEANETADKLSISRTITCLRRVCLISGVAGLCFLLFLSGPVSRLTFGTSEHAYDLALLSIMILFATITAGQTALIQGLRRIKALALRNIWGAFGGTLLSIPILYIFGEKGIVPSLLAVSAMTMVTSWWYSRQTKMARVTLTWSETISAARPLIKLGAVFMSTTLMSLGTMYLVRVIVVRYLGINSAGMYQAAIALSSVYVSFILDAMGRDFFPRLTAVARDNSACISLVNKQMEVGLLLAIPGILAIMTLAPILISIFYSAQFLPAYDVLKWQLLGVIFQVASSPMAFVFFAKGNGSLFFWTWTITNCMHLGFIWVGIKYFGLSGLGMAFFLMYAFYCIFLFGLEKKFFNFKLSSSIIRISAIIMTATGCVFLTPYFFNDKISLFIDAGITVSIGLYSLKAIINVTGSGILRKYFLTSADKDG